MDAPQLQKLKERLQASGFPIVEEIAVQATTIEPVRLSKA